MIVSYIKLSVEPVTAIVAVLNQELDESPINSINFGRWHFVMQWQSTSYKPANELCIYKSSQFIEILNSKKMNVIVGWIYCHPHTDFTEFDEYCIHNLLH